MRLSFGHSFWTYDSIWQRGPTTFDPRSILQKRDNPRVTSNKMMCDTTDSQRLKPKKRR